MMISRLQLIGNKDEGLQSVRANTQPISAKNFYFLSRHIYLCRTDDHIVLLDLRRDEYLGVDESDSDALSRYIVDWPHTSRVDTDSADSKADCSLIAQMIEAGMITQDENAGKPVTPVTVAPAAIGVLDDYSPVQVRVGLLDVLRFSKAVATAKLLLSRGSLERAVRHVEARRKRPESFVTATCDGPDYNYVRDRAAIFLRLRPFLSSAQDACLFDALALSEFLACYGIFPSWIFGVTTRPFAAHCWLQQGDAIVSDSPDNVRRFVPIMVV